MRFEIDAQVVRRTGFTLKASFGCETQALGLVGPSGSGKSTLLEAIAGIESDARVVLDGFDCSKGPVHKRNVGYVTQDALLFPHFTVRENLLFSPRADSAEEVVKALGIGHLLERMPRHLSGGEKRRVALARAIVSRPRLLLLDEPFGGLDETRRREAMSLLSYVHQMFQIPMILVSHLADEVIGLTDWAIRLEAGQVVASGPTVSLLNAGETKIDNYFTGKIIGKGCVQVGNVEISAMIPESAVGHARLACYAHDIILATTPPYGISARNIFPVRIASLIPIDEAVIVELEPVPLRALLTLEAAKALQIGPKTRAFAVIKAASIIYLGQA